MFDLEAARIEAKRIRAERFHRTEIKPGLLPYFPIEEYIDSLGKLSICLYHQDDHPGIWGYLDVSSPQDPIIWVSAAISQYRKNFTLAHELGHWLLHQDDRITSGCGAEDFDLSAVLSNDESYSPLAQRERQANAFAAELLASPENIRSAYTGGKDYPAKSIEQIAHRLKISTALARNQLRRSMVSGSREPEAVNEKMPPPKLDDEQIRAIEATVPALIIAGPGSGKTTTLVERIHRMQEQGTDTKTILALTFSRKASDEMYARIASRLDIAPAQAPTVTTFHQFCMDALRTYGSVVGINPDFKVYDEISAYFLLRKAIAAVKARELIPEYNPMEYFKEILAVISSAKDCMMTPEQLQALAQKKLAEVSDSEDTAKRVRRLIEASEIYAEYQIRMRRANALDFGDLLVELIRLFQQYPHILEAVQQKYAHILVDEFQDMNDANAFLLHLLAGSQQSIWAVGDPDQCIYEFRGATPANMNRFSQEYEHASIIQLRRNYRSRPRVVAAANIFAQTKLRETASDHTIQDLTAVRQDEPGEVLTVYVDSFRSETRFIAAEIQRRVQEGAAYGDIAILCRVNKLTQQMARALRGYGIPCSIAAPFFENAEVKMYLGIPGMLAGEYGGFLAAAQLPFLSLPREKVLKTLNFMKGGASFEDAVHAAADTTDALMFQKLLETLNYLRPLILKSGYTAMQAFFETSGILREILQENDERQKHASRIIELSQRFDREYPIQLTEESLDIQMTRRWKEFMNFFRIVRMLDKSIPEFDHRSKDSAHIMTAHASKGLEWPIVFAPKAARRYFPTLRRAEPIFQPEELLFDSEKSKTEQHELEEARLFYVAATRAREALILSTAERYKKLKATPSIFLKIIEMAEEVSQVDLRAIEEPDAVAPDNDAEENTLDTMQDLLFERDHPLTIRQIKQYHSCPRKFAYTSIYRFQQKNSSYIHMVRSCASAAREIWRQNTPNHTADVESIYQDNWQRFTQEESQIQPEDPFENRYYYRGLEFTDALVKELQTNTEQAKISFDVDVLYPIFEAVVAVHFHRVEEPLRSGADTGSGGIVQYDFSRGIPDSAGLQEVMLVLAARRVLRDDSLNTIQFAHAQTGLRFTVSVSDTVLKNNLIKIREAIQGIYSGNFEATPETRECARCPFALHCAF